MSTRLRERRADLMRNLYHAHQLLDEYTGDANGGAGDLRLMSALRAMGRSGVAGPGAAWRAAHL
jgi:hypothetical protein